MGSKKVCKPTLTQRHMLLFPQMKNRISSLERKVNGYTIESELRRPTEARPLFNRTPKFGFCLCFLISSRHTSIPIVRKSCSRTGLYEISRGAMPPTENIGCTSVFSLEEILEFEFHLSSTWSLSFLSPQRVREALPARVVNWEPKRSISRESAV